MQNQASNIINFSRLSKELKAEANPAGEFVYMPVVMYVPVFVPSQAAEELSVQTGESIKQENKNNVVSIYDYLGEI